MSDAVLVPLILGGVLTLLGVAFLGTAPSAAGRRATPPAPLVWS